MMGTLIIFISFRHMSMVPVARFRTEVYTRSNSNPSSFNSCPEDLASAFPFSVRPTSVHPVNRFSRFHRLSPCLNNTNLYIISSFFPMIIGVSPLLVFSINAFCFFLSVPQQRPCVQIISRFLAAKHSLPDVPDCTSHLEYVSTIVHYLNTTGWFSEYPFQMFLRVTTQVPC